jgi:carbon monoxide dehydrogenase subunit G
VIDYRDTFRFALPPEKLWEVIEEVDAFEGWWGWLSDVHLDGGSLCTGAVLHGVVTPPLPYRMRLRVELEDCRRPSEVHAGVHGDLEGHADLLLEPDGAGTRATVAWRIEMMQRPMRLAARVAHPMLRWGHDRVVEATVRGFRRRLR